MISFTDAVAAISSRFKNGAICIPDAAYIEKEEWDAILQHLNDINGRCIRFASAYDGIHQCTDRRTHGLYCEFHFHDACNRSARDRKLELKIFRYKVRNFFRRMFWPLVRQKYE